MNETIKGFDLSDKLVASMQSFFRKPHVIIDRRTEERVELYEEFRIGMLRLLKNE